jgi:allantoate deiminase
MDSGLVDALERAVKFTGNKVHRMTSGAGHDAMIMARRMPSALLFLRSPGGLSHHPDENVLPDDVAVAMAVGRQFLLEVSS